MADYYKPVTITLTANQANFLWAMMQSTVDCSDDRHSAGYAKRIRDKIEKASASPYVYGSSTKEKS